MSGTISRIARASLVASGVAIAAALAGSPAQPEKPAAASSIPAIQIVPVVPQELNPQGGGAPAATLAQAAAFAWQEFIGLSWPAATVDGQGHPLRDTPDTSCLLGDPGPRCSAQPLTWQTLRGKAEIFTNGKIDPNYNSGPSYTGRYPSGDPAPCTRTLPPPPVGQSGRGDPDPGGRHVRGCGADRHEREPIPPADPVSRQGQSQRIQLLLAACRALRPKYHRICAEPCSAVGYDRDAFGRLCQE